LTQTKSYSVFGRYGHFFNFSFELGLDASWTRVEDGNSADFWDAGVFGNFHFPTSTPWLPYVGLFAGYADGTNVDSSGSWGAQAGAKYFFNPNVAGFMELRWRDLQHGDNQTGLFLVCRSSSARFVYRSGKRREATAPPRRGERE
jgi:hypothetical protein